MVGSVFVFKLGEYWRDSHFRAGDASNQRKKALFVQEDMPIVGLVQKRKQTGGSSAEAASGKTVGQFFKRGTKTQQAPPVAFQHDKECFP